MIENSPHSSQHSGNKPVGRANPASIRRVESDCWRLKQERSEACKSYSTASDVLGKLPFKGKAISFNAKRQLCKTPTRHPAQVVGHLTTLTTLSLRVAEGGRFASLPALQRLTRLRCLQLTHQGVCVKEYAATPPPPAYADATSLAKLM